jgi:hypothetical protein
MMCSADAQVRHEPGGFHAPVVGHGLRTDDQEGRWAGHRRYLGDLLLAAGGFGRSHGGGLGGELDCGSVRPTFLVLPREPSERLERLTETHVVGQDAPEAVRGEVAEEVEAVALVGPQLGVDLGWDFRRDAGLKFGCAALDEREFLLADELPGRRIGQLQGVQALWFGGQFMWVDAELGELGVFLGG